MKKVIIGFLILTCILFNIYSQDSFWVSIQNNSLHEAEKIALERVKNDEIYHLYLSNIYSLLGDQDKFGIYRFNYDKNPNNNYDLNEIATEISNEYESSYIYSFLGILLWENNLRKNSEIYFKESIIMDENNPFGNNYYSMIFYGNENYIEYLKYALKAIELKEDYSEAYNNAAVAYNGLNKQDEAIQLLKQCIIKSEKPHINTYYNLLNSVGTDGISIKNRRGEYTVEGDSRLSDDNIIFIYDLLKNSTYKYEQMLDVLIDRADYSEAFELIELANERNINISKNYFLAELYYLNQNEKFFEYTEKILDENLSFEKFYNIAGTYYAMGNFDKAVLFYKKSLSVLDTDNTLYGMRINVDLGSTYLNLGENEVGIRYLEKGLEYNKYDVIALANIGYYYKENNQIIKAKSYLEKALEYADDESFKSQINDLLNQL